MVKYTYSVAAPVVSMKSHTHPYSWLQLKPRQLQRRSMTQSRPPTDYFYCLQSQNFGASPRLDNENNIREHV